jgi:hypothetical protein
MMAETNACRKSFADWLEPWCAGFIACREGLDGQDAAAFIRAAREAFDSSGSERARRLLESGDEAEILRVLQEGLV